MTHHSTHHNHFPLLFQVALDLFRLPSPSGREDLIRAYVIEHLERHGFTVSVDSTGNVLAVRGIPDPQEGYPLLSFHMDCVSYGEPFLVEHTADFSSSVVASLVSPTRTSRHTSKQQRAAQLVLRPLDSLDITRGWLHSRGAFVLGGDDKCGGAIALTLAATTATTSMPLKIIASVEEEIGCVGIEQVDPSFLEDVAYALVLDRRGANHLVVSIAGQPLCQGAFAAAMMRAAATTGLLVYAVEGALSDARTLARSIPNVVNVSVGYYRPHTVDERVSLINLWHSYQWVDEALRSLPRRQSDLVSSYQTREEDTLLCPHCQKLTIATAPMDLPEDLWVFVCRCATEPDQHSL